GWIAAFRSLLACIYQLPWAADTAPLKYKFEVGKTYTDQVRIEAQTPEYTETITGETIYNVKLADARSGNLTLTHSATLTPQRQYRQQGGIRRIGPPMMGPNFSFSSFSPPREIVIDPRGQILRYEVK